MVLRRSPSGPLEIVPTGPTGPTGPAGATGATGPQGVTGPTGPAAEIGQSAALDANFDVSSVTPAAIGSGIAISFTGITGSTLVMVFGRVAGEFVVSGSGATPIAQIDYEEFDGGGAPLGSGTLLNSISQAPDSDAGGSEFQECCPSGVYSRQDPLAVSVTFTLLAGRQTGAQWQLRPATSGGAVLWGTKSE